MSISMLVHEVVKIETTKTEFRVAKGHFRDWDNVAVLAVDKDGGRFEVTFCLSPGFSAQEIGAITLPAVEQPAKPFSTYPENRAKMLALCERVSDGPYVDFPDFVYELAGMVKAILTDEAAK